MNSLGIRRPFIVGIGGTPRLGSTSEMALRHCLKEPKPPAPRSS